MRFLVTQIMKKGTKKDWNNSEISPKIRQVLQHWGYKLTKRDFNNELKRREKTSRKTTRKTTQKTSRKTSRKK